jgi:hypothetical protein
VLLEPMDMTAGLERGEEEKIFAFAGNWSPLSSHITDKSLF